MLTLELSSHVLEMANDSLTTLTQNLIDFSILKSKVLQAVWLILHNNEKATFNINMPY